MPAGNGFMFRARRQEDAELFVEEIQGRRHRRPSRRETAGFAAVLVLLLVAWGAWEVLG